MRRLVPLIVLVLLLTGCKVKIDQGFELNNDGSGTAGVVIAFDEELMELMESATPGNDPMAEMTSDLPAGWQSTDWSEGEFTGVETSTDFSDLAELRSIVTTTFTGENGLLESFEIAEEPGGGFRLDAVVSGANLEEGLQGMEGFDLGGSIDDLSGSFFIAEVSVKFPGEVPEHNADTKKSDGTLVWKIGLADSGRSISAVSAPGSGFPLTTIAAVVGVLVLLIVGFVLWKRQSSSSTVTDTATFPVAPPVFEPVGPVDGDPFA